MPIECRSLTKIFIKCFVILVAYWVIQNNLRHLNRILVLGLVFQEGRAADVNAKLAKSISKIFKMHNPLVIIGVCLPLFDEGSQLLICLVEIPLILLLELLNLRMNRYWLLGLEALRLHCLYFFDDLAELLLHQHGNHIVDPFIRTRHADFLEQLLEHGYVKFGLVFLELLDVLLIREDIRINLS